MDVSWDADKYAQDFSFVHKYGNDVLELIDFDKAQTAIDLGCGNGALTERIKSKGVSVIGIDSSPDMLKAARENYSDIEFILADATDFSVEYPVDLVFSNAVFHWIDREKQIDMLSCVSKALKQEGQFVFEFGGYGNNALIHSALSDEFREAGLDYKMPFYFPTIGEYASLVEKAGLTVVSAFLFNRMTELQGENGLLNWIDMFIKLPFDNIDEESKSRIKKNTVEKLKSQLFIDGKWYADYVRIKMKAVKN